MSYQHYDYLILGQGLAGSLLGWNLHHRQQNYLIMDFPDQNSASEVSAGIVNPLIGRSFNLPWNFQELDTTARDCYTKLNLEQGLEFLQEQKILRVLNTKKQANILKEKLTDPIYQNYIGEIVNSYKSLQFADQAFWTNNCYWVDLAAITKTLQNFFIKQNRFLAHKFDYQDLQISPEIIRYQDFSFKKIIFAEGYRAIFNPFADFLEFRPAKGEILDVEIPNLKLEHILNFGHFLLPLGEDRYRLGATYGWSEWEEKIPLDKNHPLLLALEGITNLPYKIIQQKLGVRPIASGQKPVVGQHPKHPTVYFLNGLGSKGALMAPYCAKKLVEHLLDNKEINPAISTARFNKAGN